MAAKTKIILLAIAFIAIIAFSGCISKPKTETIAKGAAFVGGNNGLVLSAIPGQPPEQIYTGYDFEIGVMLENKGEAEATGIVGVAGLNPISFELVPVSQPFESLTPVSKMGDAVIPGEQTQLVFNAKAPSITGAQAQYPIQIVALYDYKTTAVSGVCVKESIIQQTTAGPEICKLVGNKPVESSGAPVKVTTVEEGTAGFNIKIKNVGGGYPYVSNTTPFNEGDIDRFKQKDRVRVSAKLGETPLECTLPVLLLTNNEATVFCPASLGVGAEYVEQLTITLDYGYVDRISTTLNILKL